MPAASVLMLSALALQIGSNTIAKIQLTARGPVPEAELYSILSQAKHAVDTVSQRELKFGVEVEYHIRRERLGFDEIPHTKLDLYWY